MLLVQGSERLKICTAEEVCNSRVKPNQGSEMRKKRREDESSGIKFGGACTHLSRLHLELVAPLSAY